LKQQIFLRQIQEAAMNVVTLSRQLGSQGSEIAEIVAHQTGFRLVSRELINQAARRAGAPEVGLAMIDELNLLGLKPSAAQTQAYLHAVKNVMEELANVGNVILVGRAGQIVLAQHTQAVHVRVIAPVALRVERVAHRLEIPLEAAHAQVEASDRYHQNYFKKYYKVPWDGAGLYDLIINTAKLTPEDAADIICTLMGKCSCRDANPESAPGDPL
jgi:cytidylate kinase